MGLGWVVAAGCWVADSKVGHRQVDRRWGEEWRVPSCGSKGGTSQLNPSWLTRASVRGSAGAVHCWQLQKAGTGLLKMNSPGNIIKSLLPDSSA